ncbi:MAG TPA: Rieske (2Fe-2S) protein [Mycobacteriales bacterium]|nr:Rieske (2Fe-2S) protein [Mycobacteriales bacterium]
MTERGEETPRVPAELPLPAYPLASETMATSYDAVLHRPTDPEAHTHPAPAVTQEKPPRSNRDPAAEKRVSFAVTVAFVASVAGSLLFTFGYILLPIHDAHLGNLLNLVLGSGLGLTMLGLGVGMILIGKHLIPAVKSEQHRPTHHSSPEDEFAAEEQLIGGVTEMGLQQRSFVRRTMLAALGLLPVPFVVGLRDLGPRPVARLRANSWTKDIRLVDIDTRVPVRLGDIDIGGMVTVMPEDDPDSSFPVNAESVVLLIHLGPGVNQPLPGREHWAADDHVAYSKICTHAGCPVGLFERQTGYLLCPCHQSTFDVPRGCTVIFGPAARALPQLPIYVDREGYFRAQRPFDMPLGPSFWARDNKDE